MEYGSSEQEQVPNGVYLPFILLAAAWVMLLLLLGSGSIAWLVAITSLLLFGVVAGFAVGWKPRRTLLALSLGDAMMIFTTPFLIAGGVVFAFASGLHVIGLVASSSGIGSIIRRGFSG